MTRRQTTLTVLVVAGLLVLSACAAGPNDAQGTGPDQAGFWLGLWQGFISPVTFVISLFDHDVNIYEVHNVGGWYNFGFLVGVAVTFSGAAGGGSSGHRRRSR